MTPAPKNKNLESLIESVVQDVLIEEGFLDGLAKGIKFAGKLAYLQATEGPEAVSDEMLKQIETFISKAKGSKMSLAGQTMLKNMEKQVAQVKKVKYRGRDDRGRYSKSEDDDYDSFKKYSDRYTKDARNKNVKK